MATVSYEQMASLLLADLNAPDNPYTNAAVQVWIKHESGSNIIGNNPLNIHYDNAVAYGLHPSGKWYSSGDGTYVASFATIQDGMMATAQFLLHLQRYQASVNALRANNAVGFLDAIAKSGWSECQYGLVTNAQNPKCHGDGKTNVLLTEYDALKQSIGITPTAPGAGGGSGSAPSVGGGAGSTAGPAPTGTTLADFLGHDGTLTLADIPDIAAKIAATAYAQTNHLTVNDIRAFLADGVGKKYSEIPLNVTDNTKNIDGSGPATGTPFGLPSVDFTALNKALEYIADPAHWLYILALGVGVLVTGYGIITLVKGYTGAPIPVPTP